MARSAIPTRERIISAANRLFYNDGIRGVSVDAVAAKAGVTKRTLYYHFKSKDDLVAAYLAARDQPNLALFRQWFAEADDGLPAQVERIFRNLARSARHPKWKGCGFLRTSAELANMPGHPAMKIGAAHKKKFEEWLRTTFEMAGIAQAAQLARQILLLLDGSFAVVLLHRDPSYMETAGEAARALIETALPVRGKRRARAPNSNLVGWAERSVSTMRSSIGVGWCGWWACRFAPLPTLRQLRYSYRANPPRSRSISSTAPRSGR